MAKSFGTSKVYGRDGISVRMIKLCDSATVKPLSMIYRNCLTNSLYPETSKKSIFCPTYKRNDKQIINDYKPVSLLRICEKHFERNIFKDLFDNLEENKSIS